MSNKTVDCRGLACPQPVIQTKRAVEELASGRLTVIVDNEVAKNNVVKFAAANALGAGVEEQNGQYYITIVKGADYKAAPNGKSTAADGETGSQVYLVTQNTLGHGSPELGAVLMKAFMSTLLEVKPQPLALLFINGGVKLAIKGSPVVEQLTMLAGRGVTILSCGTCLDFYQCKSELAIGEITNMYTILETINTHKTVTL
ncbi:hypothetical protein SRRS_54590 [Sporomusa rhizae]|uniref:sulfurtransferase-like selenium metabolism protein YedF n=1 Tax=Sporomusa rhizae TaxID=357999 RepID=UPI00352B5E83